MRIALDTNILAYAEGVRGCAALPGRAPAEARTAVLSWADAFDVADSTFDAMRAALDLAADHRLQIWDALILSVAADQKCRLLLSEDFQHGFTWRGVTALNPFQTPRHALLAGVLQ